MARGPGPKHCHTPPHTGGQSAIFNTLPPCLTETFRNDQDERLERQSCICNRRFRGASSLGDTADGRIGAAIARSLATFPLKGLALHYARSFDASKSLQDELEAVHPALNVTLHQADLAEPEQCQSLVREVLKTHGKIDIFISNAGGARRITDILCHHHIHS